MARKFWISALAFSAMVASGPVFAAGDELHPIRDSSFGAKPDYLSLRCSGFLGAVFIYRNILTTKAFYGSKGRNNTDFDWIDDATLKANLEASRKKSGADNYKYTAKYLKALGPVTATPAVLKKHLYKDDKATCLEAFGADTTD
ncbi:MAG: hypothetical protein AAFQ04_08575 [Pseudomonadota bacterium]